jgi:hypothetical protein
MFSIFLPVIFKYTYRLFFSLLIIMDKASIDSVVEKAGVEIQI